MMRRPEPAARVTHGSGFSARSVPGPLPADARGADIDSAVVSAIRDATMLTPVPGLPGLWHCIHDGDLMCVATEEQLERFAPALLARERRFRRRLRLLLLGFGAAAFVLLAIGFIRTAFADSPWPMHLPSGEALEPFEVTSLTLADGRMLWTGGQPLTVWVREGDARLWGID